MDCAVIAQPYNHVSNIRRKNIWYSIGSGNWTDPNIWMSNALTPSANIANQYPGQGSATYVFPRVGDDVYIGFGHTITCNTSTTLNNLYVAGSLLFDAVGRSVSVAGDLQATGSVALLNATHTLSLFGANNYINTFSSTVTSTVNYTRYGDQPVMALPYGTLMISNLGLKVPTADTTCAGGLTINSGSLDLKTYNAFITGATNIFASGTLSKTGAGSIVFNGQVLCNAPNVKIDFTGNPSVEFRTGFQLFGSGSTCNLGTGAISFTTNSQTITNNFASGIVFPATTISGAITVTCTSNSPIYINGVWNGDNVNSKLLNNGSISFLALYTLMPTGIFDFTTLSNTIDYNINNSFTLPFTTYKTLSISGTGTKTLAGNTTVAALFVNTGSKIEFSTFDFINNGTTTFSNTALGTISKNGAGNILFAGNITFSGRGVFDLSGNPSVECRGGIRMSGLDTFNSGTGQWTFSTNNQSFSLWNNNLTWIFNGNVLISGAITVTLDANTLSTLIFRGTLNGNNAASTFDNRSAIQIQNAQQPMLTGALQANAAANTVLYNAAGDQNVTGGTYRTLTLAGSGVKTLQGNVVVATAYTLTPPATLNTNGFTRT